MKTKFISIYIDQMYFTYYLHVNKSFIITLYKI